MTFGWRHPERRCLSRILLLEDTAYSSINSRALFFQTKPWSLLAKNKEDNAHLACTDRGFVWKQRCVSWCLSDNVPDYRRSSSIAQPQVFGCFSCGGGSTFFIVVVNTIREKMSLVEPADGRWRCTAGKTSCLSTRRYRRIVYARRQRSTPSLETESRNFFPRRKSNRVIRLHRRTLILHRRFCAHAVMSERRRMCRRLRHFLRSRNCSSSSSSSSCINSNNTHH